MEYTIKALADLAGVTTRTLRWYDQAGLLKPCRVRPNGYRIYGWRRSSSCWTILPSTAWPPCAAISPPCRPNVTASTA